MTRSPLTRCLPMLGLTGAALIIQPAMAEEDTGVDTYKSWTMLYGREKAPSDDLTMLMGLEMQPTFTLTDSLNPTADKSEFSFQRLRWFMRGSVTRDVDYQIVTEWARNAITSAANGSSRVFRANVTFRDVLDATNIQVGSIIVPLGQAFYIPAGVAPWVNYTRMTGQLYGCGSIGCTADSGEIITNIFKTGIMAFNQVNLSSDSSLTYTAGVYNSTGILQQDDGDAKDFNGSLEFHKGSVWLGYGTRLGSVRVSGNEFGRERHAIDLRYNDYIKDKWWIWGEGIMGKDETTGADLKANGYELSAGYKFMPKWEVVGRYSTYDPNTTVSNNSFKEISLGLNQSLGHNMRLQYQLDHNKNDNNTVDDKVFTIRLTVPLAKKLL